jgi:HEPN domain-containing protein
MSDTERWLSFARDDLRAAEILLREDVYSLSCFHAQQAVEKALKATLSFLQPDRALPRTHSISELANRLGDFRARLPDGIDELDAFYVPTRYPDALPGTLPSGLPGAADAKETLDVAKSVLSIVGALVDSMSR